MHWSRKAVFGKAPPPLAKHTMTLVGPKLFVIGGSHIPLEEEKEVFNDLAVFDLETAFWSTPPTTGEGPPHKFKAHTSTLVDQKIYVFGGGEGHTYFNDLFVLDTKTMHWTRPAVRGQVPGKRRAHTATAVGKKIYVFGGGDGSSPLKDTYILETEQLTWSLMQPRGRVYPDPRGYHTATLSNGVLMFFGGSDTCVCHNDMIMLDIATCGWAKRRMPSSTPRYGHSATHIGSWLFIFGGCTGEGYTASLDVLNLDTMEWVDVSVSGEPPTPRGFHTAVYHDSRAYIFGGQDGAIFFDDLMVLDLGTYSFLPMVK